MAAWMWFLYDETNKWTEWEIRPRFSVNSKIIPGDHKNCCMCLVSVVHTPHRLFSDEPLSASNAHFTVWYFLPANYIKTIKNWNVVLVPVVPFVFIWANYRFFFRAPAHKIWKKIRCWWEAVELCFTCNYTSYRCNSLQTNLTFGLEKYHIEYFLRHSHGPRR